MNHIDCKIVLIGDTSVGKSSLVHWFLYGKNIDTQIQPTIGSSFLVKEIEIDNKKLRFNIWDTAGQERFRSLSKIYFRNSKGCLCVFDVTKRSTFEELKYWIQCYVSVNDNNKSVIIIIANKCDYDENKWQISKEEIHNFAVSNNCKYVFTNCTNGDNTIEAFTILGHEILKSNLLQENNNTDIIIVKDLDDNHNITKCYC